MGGWQLEVGKMAMYVAFPVAVFYWFNQPEYFERWVIQKKREMYPPAHLDNHNQIQEAIQTLRQKQQEEYLAKMEGKK